MPLLLNACIMHACSAVVELMWCFHCESSCVCSKLLIVIYKWNRVATVNVVVKSGGRMWDVKTFRDTHIFSKNVKRRVKKIQKRHQILIWQAKRIWNSRPADDDLDFEYSGTEFDIKNLYIHICMLEWYRAKLHRITFHLLELFPL